MEHSAKKYYSLRHKIGWIAYGSFIQNNYWAKFKIWNKSFGMVLLDNQDMYGQYDCSCENGFLSSRVYSLNSYNIWQGTLAHLEC